MLRDAWFCSLLTCFFSRAVSAPPLALRSLATCLLMPCCCFSSFSGSTRSELAALDALSDAVLLIFAALADFVVAIVGGVGIVLVGVDLLRHLILLLVDLGFFGRRQLSAVGRAVRAGFLVDGCFLVFKVGGFAGS